MEELLDESPYVWGIDFAIDKAEADGFVVVRSTPMSLLLDLDDGPSWDRYRKVVASIGALYGIKEIDKWRSKSGSGFHVVLSCNKLGFESRVALQACLGSDPIREALAIAMHRDGHIEPSVLFQPKVKAPI